MMTYKISILKKKIFITSIMLHRHAVLHNFDVIPLPLLILQCNVGMPRVQCFLSRLKRPIQDPKHVPVQVAYTITQKHGSSR